MGGGVRGFRDGAGPWLNGAPFERGGWDGGGGGVWECARRRRGLECADVPGAWTKARVPSDEVRIARSHADPHLSQNGSGSNSPSAMQQPLRKPESFALSLSFASVHWGCKNQ